MTLTYAGAGRSLHRFLRADTPHFHDALQRLIVENEIYLVSRSDLNDPFDMRPLLHCDWTTDGIRRHIINILNNPALSAAGATNVVRLIENPQVSLKPATNLKVIRGFKNKFYDYMNELLDNVGICCFTEGLQNPLFWAHYAGSYKGICLELKAASDIAHPFRNCMKVLYTDVRPTILASHTGAMTTVYNTPNWNHISQYGFCTKSTDWAVENEWRFWIPGMKQTYQSLPNETVRSIFIGPRATDATREFVVGLVRRSNSNVKVFATSLSESTFKVEISRRIL